MTTFRVRAANQATPRELAPDLPLFGHTLKGDPYTVILAPASKLSDDTKEVLYKMMDDNMYPIQSTSSFPYTRQDKWAEMFDRTSRFLLLLNAPGTSATSERSIDGRTEVHVPDGLLGGFVEFRFDTEETNQDRDAEVVYLYEIQLKPSARGSGLAAKMMEILENIGKTRQMEKVMLTCLKRNTGALAFYDKLGYKTDEIDPTRMAQEWSGSEDEEEEEADYVILSKGLPRARRK